VTTDSKAEPVTLWRRMASAMHGEVSAEQLEAFRRAGSGAYDLYLEADQARSRLALSGIHPWQAPKGTSYQLLCTWNAHVLQSLASTLLDADYAAMPSTRGFLPPVTAQQAWAWFEPVQPWIAAAHQAAAGGLEPPTDLPADLPAWIIVEPCPAPHLNAMLTVAGGLNELLEASLATVSGMPCPKANEAQLAKITQLAVAAQSAVEYCQSLAHARADERLHELIEQRLHAALELQYHLGQLIASPSLIDSYAPDTQPSRSTPTLRPDDPWCLTDPRSRTRWQADSKARDAITQLWRYDPDPNLTRGLAKQVEAALGTGQLRYATDSHGTAFGNYFCCPWSAIYEVRQPIRLLGRRLRPGQQFTVDVSAEEVPETGEFVRRIVTGPFSQTTKIDYCDPNADGHED
jgi:hypothetical protein